MNSQEVMAMFERQAELRGQLRAQLLAKLSGEERGEKRGELRGYLRGQRNAVLDLLRCRFGTLREGLIVLVQVADADIIDEFADRLLSASSLGDVFIASKVRPAPTTPFHARTRNFCAIRARPWTCSSKMPSSEAKDAAGCVVSSPAKNKGKREG